MKIEYGVQIAWSSEDGAYIAMSADLPGCMADGQTPEEALANLRVIEQEWIETANEKGRTIPKPKNVEEMARVQQIAQAQLKQHIEQEVNQAVQRVLPFLFEQLQSTQSWAIRGRMAGNPSEELEPSGEFRRG